MNLAEGGTVPSLEDLCIFRVREEHEAPPAEAGAAMLALIEADEFPSWALCFHEALSAAGRNHDPPPTLALVAEDAILLAPRFTPGGWTGFLIAEDTAAGQPRAFHPPGQPDVATWLAVPVAPKPGAVWAAAAASLPTLPTPSGSGSPQAQRQGSNGSTPASSDDPAM